MLLLSGFVINKRVMGELAVSRSIGDSDFKENGLKLVIATPEVEHVQLQESDDFLLLACDGLFDVMADGEAVSWLRNHLVQHNDPDMAVRDLVRHSIQNLSSRDNVSAILVCFKSRFSVD